MSNAAILLKGNVGSDQFDNLQLKQFTNGDLIINFSLAKHYYANNPAGGDKIKKTDWYHMVARGEVARRIALEVQKGDYMWVEGHVNIRHDTKNPELKRSFTEVLVTSFIVSVKRGTANAYTAPTTVAPSAPVTVNPNTVTPVTTIVTPPPPNDVQPTEVPPGHTLGVNPDGSLCFVPIVTPAIMGGPVVGKTQTF